MAKYFYEVILFPLEAKKEVLNVLEKINFKDKTLGVGLDLIHGLHSGYIQHVTGNAFNWDWRSLTFESNGLIGSEEFLSSLDDLWLSKYSHRYSAGRCNYSWPTFNESQRLKNGISYDNMSILYAESMHLLSGVYSKDFLVAIRKVPKNILAYYKRRYRYDI